MNLNVWLISKLKDHEELRNVLLDASNQLNKKVILFIKVYI